MAKARKKPGPAPLPVHLKKIKKMILLLPNDWVWLKANLVGATPSQQVQSLIKIFKKEV